MKKVWGILLAAITLLLAFSACAKNKVPDGDVEYTAKIVRTNGALNGVTYPQLTQIGSKTELENYIDRYGLYYKLNEMDGDKESFIQQVAEYRREEYFAERQLAVLLLSEESEDIGHEVRSVASKRDVLTITVKRLLPKIPGELGSEQWHITVAIPRQDYKKIQIEII